MCEKNIRKLNKKSKGGDQDGKAEGHYAHLPPKIIELMNVEQFYLNYLKGVKNIQPET